MVPSTEIYQLVTGSFKLGWELEAAHDTPIPPVLYLRSIVLLLTGDAEAWYLADPVLQGYVAEGSNASLEKLKIRLVERLPDLAGTRPQLSFDQEVPRGLEADWGRSNAGILR